MRSLKRLSIIPVSLLLLVPGLLAQGKQSGKGSRPRAGGGLAKGPAVKPGVASRRGTTTTSSSTSRVSKGSRGSNGSSLFSRGSRGFTSSGNTRAVSPNAGDVLMQHCDRIVRDTWAYNPYYAGWYDRRFAYDSFYFLSSLGTRYGAYNFSFDQAMNRFSYGDSFLSPEVMGLAFQDSNLAADTLLVDVRSLRQVVEAYQDGAIDRDTFERQARIKLNLIRDSAKRIRKDYFVNFVDTSTVTSENELPMATSLPDLKQLVDQLEQTALQMKGRLASMSSSERDPRVVEVSELRQESIQSLSKGIDALSKAIRKSTRKL